MNTSWATSVQSSTASGAEKDASSSETIPSKQLLGARLGALLARGVVARALAPTMHECEDDGDHHDQYTEAGRRRGEVPRYTDGLEEPTQ